MGWFDKVAKAIFGWLGIYGGINTNNTSTLPMNVTDFTSTTPVIIDTSSFSTYHESLKTSEKMFSTSSPNAITTFETGKQTDGTHSTNFKTTSDSIISSSKGIISTTEEVHKTSHHADIISTKGHESSHTGSKFTNSVSESLGTDKHTSETTLSTKESRYTEEQHPSYETTIGSEATPTGKETTYTGSETTPTGSETTYTGSETTPTGSDTTYTGSETTSTGNETTYTGSETTPTGNETTYTGSETTPTGTASEITPTGTKTTKDAGHSSTEAPTKPGLSRGSVAGIVIGTLLIVAIVAGGVVFIVKQRRSDPEHERLTA